MLSGVAEEEFDVVDIERAELDELLDEDVPEGVAGVADAVEDVGEVEVGEEIDDVAEGVRVVEDALDEVVEELDEPLIDVFDDECFFCRFLRSWFLGLGLMRSVTFTSIVPSCSLSSASSSISASYLFLDSNVFTFFSTSAARVLGTKL